MTATLLILALAASPAVQRDPPRIHRDRGVIKAFTRAHPCPAQCAVYKRSGAEFVLWRRCGACQVDHVCPLACGGADEVSNLQWLTAEDNRAKSADCSACNPTIRRRPREP